MGDKSLPRETGSSSKSELSRAHVLMVPHPSLPYILPMVHVAEHIVSMSRGRTRVTLLGFRKMINPLVQELINLSPDVHLIGLPDDHLSATNPGAMSVDMHIERLEQAAEQYVQNCAEQKEAGLPGGPTFLISDFLHLWTTKISTKLKIPRLVMSSTSACSIAVSLAYSELGTVGHQLTLQGQATNVPGTAHGLTGPTTRYNKLPHFTIQEVCMRHPRHVLGIAQSVKQAIGIGINTFEELEADALDSIRQMIPDSFVMAVGPLQSPVQYIKSDYPTERRVEDQCMEYLKSQPKNSVIYVNFGTTGLREFSKLHLHDLARGMEASGRRFLWVLNLPPLIRQEEALPEGFEDRVKDRGLVVRGWAPQLDILSHPSTRAFLMHCGWNSCLESIGRGVPIIAWPFAGQLHHARYLADKAKVALLLPQEENHRVRPEDLEHAIRNIFFSEEGMRLKEKVMELKATSMIVCDGQGSSYVNLQKLIKLISFL